MGGSCFSFSLNLYFGVFLRSFSYLSTKEGGTFGIPKEKVVPFEGPGRFKLGCGDFRIALD